MPDQAWRITVRRRDRQSRPHGRTVPLALSQGTFDGLVEPNESCAQRQTVGGGRQVLLGRPSVHPPIHPDDQRRVLGQAGARPAEDDDGPVGAEHRRPIAPTWRRLRPRRARRWRRNGIKFSDPTADAERCASRKLMMADQDNAERRRPSSPPTWSNWSTLKRRQRHASRAPASKLSPRLRSGGTGSSETLVGLLGRSRMLVGLLQVVGRYFDPEHAISWAEEVIVYLVVWAMMIVSSQLVRTDGHVRPDLVLRLLPPRGSAGSRSSTASWRWCSAAAWSGTAGRSSILRCCSRSAARPICSSRCGFTTARCRSAALLMFVRYCIRL